MKDVSFLDDMLAPVTRQESQPAPVAEGLRPAKEGLQHLPLDRVQVDPNQPRKQWDEDALRDMAGSILQYGILQPVTVTEQDGRYRLVTGERRYRAAILARDSGEACRKVGYDLSGIPALVVENAGGTETLEQQLIENLAREDMAPRDTAAALQQVLAQTGCSKTALAKRLGKSAAWLRGMLVLVDPALPEKAADAGVSLENMGVAEARRLLADEPENADELATPAGFAQESTLPDTVDVHTERDEPDIQEPSVEAAETVDAEPDNASDTLAESEPDGSFVAPVVDAGVFMATITLPEAMWQVLLVKTGVEGLVCVDTVREAIERLELS